MKRLTRVYWLAVVLIVGISLASCICPASLPRIERATATPTPNLPSLAVVVERKAEMRIQPSTEHGILRTYPKGTEMIVFSQEQEKEGSWFFAVAADGLAGWVPAESLELRVGAELKLQQEGQPPGVPRFPPTPVIPRFPPTPVIPRFPPTPIPLPPTPFIPRGVPTAPFIPRGVPTAPMPQPPMPQPPMPPMPPLPPTFH